MIQFTPQETKLLQHLGRTEYGQEFVRLLDRMKDHYSSISTIDKTRDTNAQVEGREIFVQIVKELTKTITVRSRNARPLEPDDFT